MSKPTAWSVDRVSAWLASSGLSDIITPASEAGLDGATLMTAKDSDLERDLPGVTFPRRTALLAARDKLAISGNGLLPVYTTMSAPTGRTKASVSSLSSSSSSHAPPVTEEGAGAAAGRENKAPEDAYERLENVNNPTREKAAARATARVNSHHALGDHRPQMPLPSGATAAVAAAAAAAALATASSSASAPASTAGGGPLLHVAGMGVEPSQGVLVNNRSKSADALCSDGFRHSGWLTKRGDLVKSWKLRWTIVKDGAVFYYRTPQSKQAKGCFSLKGYQVQPGGDARRPNGFRLVPMGGRGREWHFTCANASEVKTWTSLLTREILSVAGSSGGGASSGGGTGVGVGVGFVGGDVFEEEQESGAESVSDEEQTYDEPYSDAIELPNKPLSSSSSSSSSSSASAPVPAPPTSTTLVARGAAIQTRPWFFLGSDRTQAEAMLRGTGRFLVRQRDEQNLMVISVSVGAVTKHYKIFEVAGQGLSVGGDNTVFFADPIDLLRHYQAHNLPREGPVLVAPFELN